MEKKNIYIYIRATYVVQRVRMGGPDHKVTRQGP